jgi:hypothetical protein
MGNAPTGCWRPLGQRLKYSGDLSGKAQIVFKTLWECLPTGGDILGNAQFKVKT